MWCDVLRADRQEHEGSGGREMRPVEGTLLGNRYKLTSRIAVGGMGEVWKGVDSVLGRAVAAKILKDEYLSEKSFLALFHSSAQHMGRTCEPNFSGDIHSR